MDDKTKLNKIRNCAWELLKYSPSELKKQGINPINLVGTNFAIKEMLNEMESESDRNF